MELCEGLRWHRCRFRHPKASVVRVRVCAVDLSRFRLELTLNSEATPEATPEVTPERRGHTLGAISPPLQANEKSHLENIAQNTNWLPRSVVVHVCIKNLRAPGFAVHGHFRRPCNAHTWYRRVLFTFQ